MVKRFLSLKPEFKTLFNKVFTRDNEDEWIYFDIEKHPLECKAGEIDPSTVNSKPITTFGYDAVLFIDDNRTEAERLTKLFEITKTLSSLSILVEATHT